MREDIGLDGLRIDIHELDEEFEMPGLVRRKTGINELDYPQIDIPPAKTAYEYPRVAEAQKDITAQLKAAKVKGKYILIDDVLKMLE